MLKVRMQDLVTVGGCYAIFSGNVDFFHEASGDDKDAGIAPGKQPVRGVASRFLPSVGNVKVGQYIFI